MNLKLVAQLEFSVAPSCGAMVVMVVEERCTLRRLEVVGGERLAVQSFRVGSQSMFTTGAPVPADAIGAGLFEMGCGPGTLVEVTLRSYSDVPVDGCVRLHADA